MHNKHQNKDVQKSFSILVRDPVFIRCVDQTGSTIGAKLAFSDKIVKS